MVLICGSGSFHESGDELDLRSPNNKTKRSRRSGARSCRSSNVGKRAGDVKKSKNPYATRGLDKFSSLVADLKEKRQTIYAQTGDDSDDLYIWFNFSGSDDCKPIVLKLKDKKQKIEKKELGVLKDKTTVSDKPEDTESLAKGGKNTTVVQHSAAAGADNRESNDRAGKKSTSLMSSYYAYYTVRLRQRPLLCLLTAVILILILLSVFGRSVTVMWITVGWYLLPTRNDIRSGVRNKKTFPNDAPMSPNRAATADQRGELCSLTKKKENVRKPSENRLTMSLEAEPHHRRESW